MYIVITGTSKGIGLALTRVALSMGHHVLGIARNTSDTPLKELKREYPNLELLDLDLSENNACAKISDKIANWPMVDVVINNAGVYNKDENIKDFENSFLINSVIPFFITRSLFPLLKKSSHPLSLQITSIMGSLADNTSGGSYSYRASKSALNMLFKSLSIDEKWLQVLLVHPGWVKTRMGGDAAPVEAKQSAEGIWKIIQEASSHKEELFLDYQGKKLPW